MKINIQKFNKRILPFLVVVAVALVCCVPLTAYAAYPTAPIDYRDLDYTVKEGYAYNEVTVPLSSDFCRLVVVKTGSSSPVASTQGRNSLIFAVEHSTQYDATLYPVSHRGLSLANIPNGSRLVFDLHIDFVYEDVNDETTVRPLENLFQKLRYLNSNGNQIGKTITGLVDGYSNEDITVTFDLDSLPSDAFSVVPYITMEDFNFDRGVLECKLSLTNVSLVMDIPNGYWEQWVVEQNGQMIDNLGDRIESSINDSTDRIEGAISDSTDKIVNGTEEQNQSAQDFSESMDSAIGDLESAGDSLNQVGTPDVDVDTLIPNDVLLGESYLNYVTAIQTFWDCEILAKVLTFLGVLILISVVFFGLRG